METRLFLRNFTTLDYAFLCPNKGLQGESFAVSAELIGDLDAQGFVMDFGSAKKLLKTRMDELVDHRLLVPLETPRLERKNSKGNQELYFSTLKENFHYSAPSEAFVFLEAPLASASAVERYLEAKLLLELPKTVRALKITLADEDLSADAASFRYTHGLRLHEGNCQRLFHGHRNQIEVFVDGAKAPAYEKELAETFADAHFAIAESVEKRGDSASIRYRSSQGEFAATLPSSRLILLKTEPSIENIALWALRFLEERHPQKNFQVRAYEGIQKGATVG